MIEQLARVLEEAEAGQLPALIAEWSTADASRRAIAGALRVDLAVLATLRVEAALLLRQESQPEARNAGH